MTPLNRCTNFIDFFIDNLIELSTWFEDRCEKYCVLESHSSIVDQSTGDDGLMDIMAFHDENVGHIAEVESFRDRTRQVGVTSAGDLSRVLSRPTRILDASWIVGQPLIRSFDPWTLFLSNSLVQDKIRNYNLLSGDLHLKVVVNGTRFHFGRAIFSYNPLPSLDTTAPIGSVQEDVIRLSQRQHVYIDACESMGGELKLPFFYPNNQLRIPTQDWQDLGQINVRSITSLEHANGGNDPVTISVYAWMDNISLAVPTTLTSQSKKSGGSSDEYSSLGPVAKAATAISIASGALSKFPVIGEFATATSLASGAAAVIATLFGWSRPRIIDKIQRYKPQPHGQTAVTDAPDGAETLALTSKQEVTIDTRVHGLSGDDELSIQSLIERESFLTKFVWAPSNLTDANLFSMAITPSLFDTQQSDDDVIHMTPMCAVASMFRKWHGTIVVRFSVVATGFHKGRMLIRYDPNTLSAANAEQNLSFSRIIDIGDKKDFEIEVGWAQPLPWLDCDNLFNTVPFSAGTIYPAFPTSNNGTLSVTVLNQLVSPSVDSSIEILVSVRGKQMLFADPSPQTFSQLHYRPPVEGPPTLRQVARYTKLTSHSEVEDMGGDDSDNPIAPVGAPAVAPVGDPSWQDQYALVFYGEMPVSIRQLFKRYFYHNTWVVPQPSTPGTYNMATITNTDFPLNTGFVANGLSDATVGGTFNNVGAGPLSFCSPWFAGMSGSARKKYFVESDLPLMGSPTVLRMTPTLTDITQSNFETATNLALQVNDLYKDSFSGEIAHCLYQNSCMEVELPWYRPQRFASPRLIDNVDPGRHKIKMSLPPSTGPGKNVVINEYQSVGEDFNLFYFTGIPPMWRYTVSAAT